MARRKEGRTGKRGRKGGERFKTLNEKRIKDIYLKKKKFFVFCFWFGLERNDKGFQWNMFYSKNLINP